MTESGLVKWHLVECRWSKCQLAEPVMLPSGEGTGTKLGEGREEVDFQPFDQMTLVQMWRHLKKWSEHSPDVGRGHLRDVDRDRYGRDSGAEAGNDPPPEQHPLVEGRGQEQEAESELGPSL